LISAVEELKDPEKESAELNMNESILIQTSVLGAEETAPENNGKEGNGDSQDKGPLASIAIDIS